MKRNGFTLSEALIALGILGVIAAITMPMVNQIIPDKDKAMVLKAYQTIKDVNNTILNDPSLYLPCMDNNVTKPILACKNAPVDSTQHANFKNSNKYPLLFAENMNLSSKAANKIAAGHYDFETTDGLYWDINGAVNGSVANYVITINTKTEGRQECSYDKTSCTNPGMFVFNVNGNGEVNAVDSLSRAYLLNPNNLHDRNKDLAKAKELDS